MEGRPLGSKSHPKGRYRHFPAGPNRGAQRCALMAPVPPAPSSFRSPVAIVDTTLANSRASSGCTTTLMEAATAHEAASAPCASCTGWIARRRTRGSSSAVRSIRRRRSPKAFTAAASCSRLSASAVVTQSWREKPVHTLERALRSKNRRLPDSRDVGLGLDSRVLWLERSRATASIYCVAYSGAKGVG
jgi:hypothetical protein